ncbi:histidine kinase [Erwinia sp. OLTSP20]|uniref:oxygenase MpaB family protein n=1 Tax=unclassified Erwinia TaxID=2622719 RepID=UPI000C1A3901|nr:MULTISPECIES: oxygenase MpaB family protein [unclassified Erwinia]PIJ48701.1 histidine kinase [Erwinia sp. OAMSP11]PIJ69324.1 histidine kinase [Erwinia sp. OLSSP12]PIJ79158.1 histidine kinase [Erwinia sp. OLCASP19]PIJ80684.1 histidine kinase [Erwinia sp. OLMTSP26]PIJ82834.1 histidine kinase [Erwinia sp. OLMDSP33]
MTGFRDRIQQQVFRLNGLSLNEFDLSQPAGDPGLYGPDSVIWQVHGDFPSMLCGGISALLMQMLHPSALAGVWDHSRFREDMLGRLRRTSQFIAVTTFGNSNDASTLIERVKRIHLQVSGHDAQGQPYAASDPALLTWVHVAETSRFLAAHLRYKNPQLSVKHQDEYYREAARVARALGAGGVPESVAAVDHYLAQMRPALRCDERTRAVFNILMNAPSPSWQARPAMKIMLQAGIGLLPLWAQQQLGVSMGPVRRRWLALNMRLISTVLRQSIRQGACQRAMARMGRAR